MPEFAGERGRWDGQDRAPGVSQAVAADPGQHHPGERVAAASAYNQHVARLAGQVHQDPAWGSPFDVRLDQRIVGDLTPHCDECVAEPPAGQAAHFLAQVG